MNTLCRTTFVSVINKDLLPLKISLWLEEGTFLNAGMTYSSWVCLYDKNRSKILFLFFFFSFDSTYCLSQINISKTFINFKFIFSSCWISIYFITYYSQTGLCSWFSGWIYFCLLLSGLVLELYNTVANIAIIHSNVIKILW